MKTSRRLALATAGILIGLTSCDARRPFSRATTVVSEKHDQRINESEGGKMRVTIGTKSFAATLDDNPASAKLRAMLPLTLDMSELNGNEKYFHLATKLPTDPANPGTIQNGDLMLWQTDSLVLFYKTFQTTDRYTRLGRINDPAGLAAAVGSGNVTVRFEWE